MRRTTGIMCGILAVLLFGFTPAVATAQSEVKGSGIDTSSHGAVDGGNLFSHIAVNAWLDEDGAAHGRVTWEGDRFQPLPGGNIKFGGPANAYIIDVTHIEFSGNTAIVYGVVIASPNGVANGDTVGHSFTDNSGTDEPDEIDGVPITGNIIVR